MLLSAHVRLGGGARLNRAMALLLRPTDAFLQACRSVAHQILGGASPAPSSPGGGGAAWAPHRAPGSSELDGKRDEREKKKRGPDGARHGVHAPSERARTTGAAPAQR